MWEAIENLYTTFANYALDDDFVACNDGFHAEATVLLAEISLRDLTIGELEPYSRKAMTTWGTVHHFKYFLPRILELAVDHQDYFLDLSIVFGKLAYAQLSGWPKSERQAIHRYFDAYWNRQLTCPIENGYNTSSDEVLCALSNALPSVKHFLERWILTDTALAKRHLAEFILTNGEELMVQGRLASPFWDTSGAAHSEVLEWLQSDVLLEFLTRDEVHVLTGEFAFAPSQLMAIRSSLHESA